MSKLIIENRSSHSDEVAAVACLEVIKQGKISGKEGAKQYCYATSMSFVDGSRLLVYATKNKSSDKLTVIDDKHPV